MIIGNKPLLLGPDVGDTELIELLLSSKSNGYRSKASSLSTSLKNTASLLTFLRIKGELGTGFAMTFSYKEFASTHPVILSWS